MHRTLPPLACLACLLCTAAIVSAQDIEVGRDNGIAAGIYSTLPNGSEESVLLQPAGPCEVRSLRIYYSGTRSVRDTVYVCGDPAEGAIPPTAWTWAYDTIATATVDYTGRAGWFTVDLAGRGVRSDGYDRITVQHRIKRYGPWFTVDSDPQVQPWTSFLMDPTQTNSLGGPGQYLLAANDFMVRLVVRYDFPAGPGSQPPPAPTFADVTTAAGLTDGQGAPLRDAMAAVGDWNGDGRDDIAFAGRYFQNDGGGHLTDVTAALGIGAGSPVWCDMDNDGDQDAYMVQGGPADRLMRNNGDGTFTDVTAASGLSNPHPTVTPIWMDYNGDGMPDLFLANGRRESGGVETFYPDQLWRNEGGGRFTNVTDAARISGGEPAPYYDCWGASACDFNGDGRTDLFVSTYRLAPDLLYRNNGDGTFTEVGAASGVRGVPTAEPGYYGHGMGSDWGDFDDDGRQDLAVGNLGHPDWRGQWSNPSLVFRNLDGALFQETHMPMGVKFFEMNAGVTWADLDLDGTLDLWQSQYAYNPAGVNGEPRRLSRVYISDGAPAWRLRDRTWHLGCLVHGAWAVSRLDVDQDGDVDLVAASPTEGVRLFRNDIARRGTWMAVRVQGPAVGPVPRDGFGTRLILYAGGRIFHRTLSSSAAGSRAATNSLEQFFGLGAAQRADSLVLLFPDGTRQTHADLAANRRYFVRYDGGITVGTGDGPAPAGWAIEQPRWNGSAVTFTLRTAVPLGDLRVDVTDMLGRRVAEGGVSGAATGQRQVRTPGRLSSGVYFLRVMGPDGPRISRFPVLR